MQQTRPASEAPPPSNSGDIIALALKKKFSSILSPQKPEGDAQHGNTAGDDWTSPPQTEKMASRHGNLVAVYPKKENKENVAAVTKQGKQSGARRFSVEENAHNNNTFQARSAAN